MMNDHVQGKAMVSMDDDLPLKLTKDQLEWG